MSSPRLKRHTARIGGVTYGFNGRAEVMAKPRRFVTMPSSTTGTWSIAQRRQATYVQGSRTLLSPRVWAFRLIRTSNASETCHSRDSMTGVPSRS